MDQIHALEHGQLKIQEPEVFTVPTLAPRDFSTVGFSTMGGETSALRRKKNFAFLRSHCQLLAESLRQIA